MQFLIPEELRTSPWVYLCKAGKREQISHVELMGLIKMFPGSLTLHVFVMELNARAIF